MMRLGVVAALLMAAPASAVEYIGFEFTSFGTWQTYEVRLNGSNIVDPLVRADRDIRESYWVNYNDIGETPDWGLAVDTIPLGSICNSNGCDQGDTQDFLRNFSVTGNRLRFTVTAPWSYDRCSRRPRIDLAVCGREWLEAQVFVDFGYEGDASGYTLSAVPEPGTWATMIVGFGLVGGLMRRRAVARA